MLEKFALVRNIPKGRKHGSRSGITEVVTLDAIALMAFVHSKDYLSAILWPSCFKHLLLCILEIDKTSYFCMISFIGTLVTKGNLMGKNVWFSFLQNVDLEAFEYVPLTL